jgi:hypothetical protein
MLTAWLGLYAAQGLAIGVCLAGGVAVTIWHREGPGVTLIMVGLVLLHSLLAWPLVLFVVARYWALTHAEGTATILQHVAQQEGHTDVLS